MWVLILALAVILLLNLLLWNKKETYIIRDGNRMIVCTAGRENPVQILEAAGIELREEDRLDLRRGPEGPVLQVLRQQKIVIDYRGAPMEATSYGETVAELLARLDLPVDGRDELSHSARSVTYDGMVLRVCRVIRQEQIYAVTLPSEIQYCCDPGLPVGTETVLTEGRNGELLRTAAVTYINGREVNREILREEITVQPITGIVAVGIGPIPEEEEQTLPVIGDGMIRLPTGEVLTYSRVISSLATAYCDKGLTATGTQARVGAIAVDPEYIPYGTRMFILSKDGEYVYGIATAEDCGSKEHIYGSRIDLHYDTEEACVQFGARMCWVYFLS